VSPCADGINPRIGSELERHETATGLAHDRHLVERDFAVEWRLGAFVLRLGPRDRSAQVVSGCPRHTGLGGCCHHHKPMRRDRRQESRVAIAVDGATTIAPHHQRQRVLAREWRQVGRSIDDVAGRVEGGA
jgi:hypothetical protein